MQIMETRYLDMISKCMKEDSGFGLIMIEEGDEVLRNIDASLPSIAHSGTRCHIVDFDQNANGTLGILVEGIEKFVIRDQYETPDRLMMASIEFLDMEEQTALPEEDRHLADLLETFLKHPAVQNLNLNINFNDARDVGWRLTELLPCENLVKQKLFEMKSPANRLKELNRLLMHIQNSSQGPPPF